MTTSLPSPNTCTWCEEAPAIRAWWDEHNGWCSLCSECSADGQASVVATIIGKVTA